MFELQIARLDRTTIQKLGTLSDALIGAAEGDGRRYEIAEQGIARALADKSLENQRSSTSWVSGPHLAVNSVGLNSCRIGELISKI